MSQRNLLGLAAAVAVSSFVSAQQAGSLRGTVYDQDFAAPLPGAVVRIVDLGIEVPTTDSGTFVFNQLKPGKYTVVVHKDGYVRKVRADLVVAAGQMTEVRFDLAGDFTDLEDVVIKQEIELGVTTEAALLELRLESPALMDSIGADMMSKSGASDAADAVRLVAGASVQDGKSAVIRGLPDRYVSSQMNGVRLPSADEDKRAVELDQFPSEVIANLQVSKTFTPDQQADASGGAVNVLLRGVPQEPLFLKWKVGTVHNRQVTGRSDFLTYQGGGVHTWGKSGGDRSFQELGENWTGAVGVAEAEAPLDYKWAVSGGGSFDLGKGWRGGGFANLFYDRDSSFYRGGRDDSYWALSLRDPLTPQFSQGTPEQGEFYTSLLDITRSKQSAQWGGLSTIGIENEHHAVTLAYLFTQAAEDKVTLAEDTRGKEYYFPGHDPLDPTSPGSDEILAAPYVRLQTLEYTERKTGTLQLSGHHEFPIADAGPLQAAELEWTIAKSGAKRDQPDKRQFASAWIPTGTYLQFKPAAQFTLGNLQRIWKKISEDSEQGTIGLKLPFTSWTEDKGYLKVGLFHDHVRRRFDQDTFSNFNDPAFFAGQFDQLDWSQVWNFQDHPITASEADIDYRGSQTVSASYGMLDLPLAKGLRMIGGARFESTNIRIVNQAEADAVWVPPGQFGTADLQPGDADVDFSQRDVLPSVSLIYEPVADVTLRLAYNETVARQTFKEITPIAQQEYLGGPVFVGNPDLAMSAVRNYDLRVDYTPFKGGLFSASYFRKDIENPIEYVEKLGNFSFTTAENYPRGKLTGYELEARQELGTLLPALDGLSLGANSTWIDASVRLPDDEILLFEQVHGERPQLSRDMTNAPDYLYNVFLTYDLPATGTSFAVFYTRQGDTLVTGPGPSNDYFVPATYERAFGTLNATLSQSLGSNVRLSLAAKNLTDTTQRQVYRSEFQEGETLRRAYSEGIEYSLTIGGEVTF